MTRLALGTKWGAGSAPPVSTEGSTAAANQRPFSSEARAAVPRPLAVRPNSWLLVITCWHSRCKFIFSPPDLLVPTSSRHASRVFGGSRVGSRTTTRRHEQEQLMQFLG